VCVPRRCGPRKRSAHLWSREQRWRRGSLQRRFPCHDQDVEQPALLLPAGRPHGQQSLRRLTLWGMVDDYHQSTTPYGTLTVHTQKPSSVPRKVAGARP
jgi:hypothetical protein